ncbi:MAG: metal-dependent hydrolase [Dehalococcoidales bacterium]|nr:metal-dependent hydrolase [Dehalococcoidales bacterium]
MLAFAHTGITLGVAVLVAGGFKKSITLQNLEDGAVESPRRFPKSALFLLAHPVRQVSSWLTALGKSIDIRLLFIGSLLPDIIDKPLGHLFFIEALSNGRVFGHTLLFFVIIALVGLYIYRSHSQLWLSVVAFGTLLHLILDQMWQTSQTLLWPVFGFAFPREDMTGWAQDTLQALLKNPAVYIPELIGAGIIVLFGWFLLRRKKTIAFIKRGEVS